MADTRHVEGLSNLSNALKELPKNIARNLLRRGASAGAAEIRDGARNKAPVLTGEMKRDIQIKRERTESDYIARYSIFVRAGKKSRLSGRARNVEKDSYYWRFVEFGTSKMVAQPFMRPAFEEKKNQAVDTFKAVLVEGIPIEVAKLPGARA